MLEVMRNGTQVGSRVYFAGEVITELPEGVTVPSEAEQVQNWGEVLIKGVEAEAPAKPKGRKKAAEVAAPEAVAPEVAE